MTMQDIRRLEDETREELDRVRELFFFVTVIDFLIEAQVALRV